MIKTIFLLFGFLFISSLVYAQVIPYNPREWDTNWTYTKFSDFFNGPLLDKDKWEVIKEYGREKCIFLDAEGTTYSVNNGLNLNMIYQPGHCFQENGIIKCRDYISAEIWSKEKFKYGIYEGRMRFATGRGSWPAFWFYGNSGADDPQYNGAYASEIDIAEYNWSRNFWGNYSATTDHVFHWWWPESMHGTKQMDIPNGIKENSTDWNTWHTFKLIYTPYEIKFYIDDALNWRRSRFYITVRLPPEFYYYPVDIFYEDIDESTTYFEYEWFPKHEGHIILSQQVSGNVYNGDIYAPQTSLFDWVTYKGFFTAPVITCPTNMCETAIATIDVDPRAINISWQLSPSSLFTTSYGNGTTANIVSVPGAIGAGKITYTFQMPSGETFTAFKDFNVGSNLIEINSTISGPSTVCSSGNTFTITNLPPDVNSIEWIPGPGLTITSGQNTSTCTFSATNIATSWVKVTLVTNCGNFTLPQKNVTSGVTASFSGNASVDYGGSGTWNAMASGCTPPYHFQWWLREETNPPVGAILVGEGSSLTLWSWPRSSMAVNAVQGLSEPTGLQPPTSTRYYLSLQAYDANGMMFETQEKLIIAYGDVDLIDPKARMAFEESVETTATQMKISPNPATDEATVELFATEAQRLEGSDWQIEIYDATQLLKTKIQKIKGSKQIIRTTGWKEGVYLIRVKVGNKVLTDKLVIKP